MLLVQNGRRIATFCCTSKPILLSHRNLLFASFRVFSKVFRMKCYLECCCHSHEPILLRDGAPVVVGRSRETKITDKKCSKKQVKLIANYQDQNVKAIQLGSNPSLIGNKELTQGESAILNSGAKIGLLHDKYMHCVSFITPATSCDKPQKDVESEIVHQSKKKKRKVTEDSASSSLPNKKMKSCSEGFGEKERNNENENLPEDIDYEEVKREFGEDMVRELVDKKRKPVTSTEDLGKASRDQELAGTFGTATKGSPVKQSDWYEIPGELFVFSSKGTMGREKIAGFDMDGTIITTKSGKVFPVNTADWKILFPEIPGRIKKLWNEGYKIVIFTNQNGIAKKKVSLPDFKKKVENIQSLLGIPVQVFVSPGVGHYRKPSMGMWKYLLQKANQGIRVDLSNSMYIGDAAGRPANWEPKRKKDFSCSDRAFAANIGIQFYTPEEFFLNKKPAPFNWPAFNPRKLQDLPLFTPTTSTLTSKEPELIVMVGCPGSGKTTFAKEHLVPKGYIRINRDTLGSWQKCVSACRTALNQGKHVIVDNTSPDVETRKRYIECAQQAKVPARCFVMDVSLDHANHNNTIRETFNTDANYKPVGFMAFNNYKSSYQDPQLSEGFTEILKIHFRPTFKDKSTEELYYQFLHG